MFTEAVPPAHADLQPHGGPTPAEHLFACTPQPPLTHHPHQNSFHLPNGRALLQRSLPLTHQRTHHQTPPAVSHKRGPVPPRNAENG